MNTLRTLRSCFIALAFAGAALAPAAHAAEAAKAAEKATALPVSATFEKAAENGPYHLHLKNTSDKKLTVDVDILQSVQSHSRPKNHKLEAQVIEAGKSLTIPEIAKFDKITVTSAGYAPLPLELK